MTAATVFVCPDGHQHGAKSTCYVQHKCRCQPCRASRAATEKNRQRQKAYGRYDSGLVPAGPVRAHIQQLQAYGMGWKRIGVVSGVGSTGVAALIYGRKGGPEDPRKGEPLKRTTRAKAEKILAVRPDLALLSPGARVSSRGTHRRLQALVARGWSQSKLGLKLDILPTNFSGLMRRGEVSVAVALRVVALYDELWNTAPPRAEWRDKIAYSRSLSYAVKHRWVPPLGWDDIDLDVTPPVPEPVEGVDVNAVALAVHGDHVRLSPLERRAAVSELWDRNWSDSRVAEQLHITPRTVLRIRQELGLPAHDQDDLIKRCAA